VYYIPKANALSLQLAARYQMGNTLSVGGQLSIFKYSNIANNSHVWHLPTSKIIGDFCWNILPELSVSAYASFIGGNYARDISGNSILLKPYADIGLGGEYLALKKLSLFLTCNNLLNIKYQRWQAYQAYGINIYGGVRLKF
jgi:hypothetical protein